jgi:hypothetical protein
MLGFGAFPLSSMGAISDSASHLSTKEEVEGLGITQGDRCPLGDPENRTYLESRPGYSHLGPLLAMWILCLDTLTFFFFFTCFFFLWLLGFELRAFNLESLHQPLFVIGIFKMGVSQTISSGWL